jgi:hypothetical protein
MSKTVPLNVRISDDMYRKLRHICDDFKKNHSIEVTLSAYVRGIIEVAIDKRSKELLENVK